MPFKRLLDLTKTKSSCFLFGPRMTGKTRLIREIKNQLYLDLLDPEKEMDLKQTPGHFWEILRALPAGSLVIVDEIQRVPALLDFVQKGIEERSLKFILSGSSARKLRRGGANLLGGRALDFRLHPLTSEEIGSGFDIYRAMQFGTLPKISECLLQNETDEARLILKSYYTTYIKEEIQAEALTRNVGAFQRFLNIAAQDNGQIIAFQNISRECGVPASTVKEYYSILEDTLLGEFLWPWDRTERKKARPKFYFFDCGVVRSIQNRLQDPSTAQETGVLFENWFYRELVRWRDYLDKDHTFSFWRNGSHEIDILVSGGHGPKIAFECKSGKGPPDSASVNAFRTFFPKIPLWVVSLKDEFPRKLESGTEVLPWKLAVEKYKKLI